MLEKLSLEIAITLYIVTLSFSALTTLFSSFTRPFSEYGKQLTNRSLGFLYISKKKHFGHMYIFAILLNCFTLYNIYSYMSSGSKNTFTAFMSTNGPVASGEGGVRLGYECVFCLVLMLFHSARRAYESFVLAQDSPSKFHFFAYLIGLLYYVGEIWALAAYAPGFLGAFPET